MSYFIWTEIYNCGKIGRISLQSFVKHHPGLKVHVFGFRKDFEVIEKSNFVIPVIINESDWLDRLTFFLPQKYQNFFFENRISFRSIINGFEEGHLGTARLWAYIIKSRKENHLIHFDSDTIFLGNIVDEMIELGQHYDLVGPIRNYKNNPSGVEFFEQFENLSSTYCFLFNRKKIGYFSYKKLVDMCVGRYIKHPVLDFFDPIMFTILENKGKIFFLDQNDVGGCDFFGKRDNKFCEINNYFTPFKLDFGNKLTHFSAVGSGMNIYFNRKVNIPSSYSEYALDRYALFCFIFYEEDLGFDLSKYDFLIKYFQHNVLPKLR
jgi:hypothetical protein